MTEEALDHRDSASVELHNSLYDRAITLLKPYLGSAGSRDDAAVGDVRRGCELLERVLELNPGNWSAAWVMGNAWKVIGEGELAYAAFATAFAIEQWHPDVARELAGMCIELGKGPEALEVAAHAMTLAPHDAGLVANHALALLINGRVDEALTEVDRAVSIDPSDAITQRLRGLVVAVQAGERPPPRRWPPD